MVEKWLYQDEGILLQTKTFIWVRTPYNYTGSWAKIFLTNKRFYAKDRIFGIKLVDLPYPRIKSVSSDEKHLHINGEVDGKRYQVKIKKKNLAPTWEWMIRQMQRSII